METPTVGLLLAAAACLHAQTGVAVEGRVVSTSDKTPIRRAVVTLRGQETYLIRSDANGHFALPDVAPGQYEVEAAREGYQTRPLAGVVIGPGVVPLEVPLTPLALLAGRIVDELGDPVPDADVEAMHFRYESGRRQLQSSARVKTNDRGEYLIADLTPSRYYLRASDAQHIPPIIGDYFDRGPRRMQIYAPAFYPGTRDPDRASMLSLAAGAELQHVDLAIHRESVYSVRGRIAQGATVRLVRRFDEPGGAYASRPAGNGQFEIWGVTPGAYTVTGSRQSTVYAARKVEVVNDDIDGVDLTGSTAIGVAGSVRGAALPGLHVVLQSEEAAALDLNAPVNANGAFTLNAQPDSYIVHVTGEGAWLKSMRIGDREVPDHRLVPGRFEGALVLEASTASGAVSGSVTGPDGKPAAAVPVTLVPDQSLPFWSDMAQVSVTDAGGSFVFPRVIPGSYRLFAVEGAASGAPLDPEFRKPFDAKGAPVQVETNGKAAVSLSLIQDK